MSFTTSKDCFYSGHRFSSCGGMPLPSTLMAGAVAIVLVLLVVIPVAVMMSGALVAAIIGFVLQRDGDARYEGSELLELDD